MLLFILMQICADLFIVCLYVLPLENQLSKEEVGAPLTGLTLPHCCACLNQGTVFPSSYVVVFWCSVSLFQLTVIVCFVGIVYHHCLKVVVCFVDIGGIVNHHTMSWSERWFLLILVELLTSLNELRWEVIFLILGELFTITQWVKMRGWFLLILVELLISLNELRWELIFVDIGGIVDITQWVEVRGDFCWYW